MSAALTHAEAAELRALAEWYRGLCRARDWEVPSTDDEAALAALRIVHMMEHQDGTPETATLH